MSGISVFAEAAIAIKEAIVRSRYQAASLVNRELLSLYYAVGKYVSENSRDGYWGKGAIKHISENLQRELPGLRGFSEASIKKMRLFYEEWNTVFSNRSSAMNDLIESSKSENRSPKTNDLIIAPNIENLIDLGLLLREIDSFTSPTFAADEFLRVGFTHQYTIISGEKALGGRFFYVSRCAAEFWTLEALKSNLRGNLYAKSGTLPSNFLQTLPTQEQAHRALRSFKDEYFLDFINIEDENDPDERILEHGIIDNIKQFILAFGGSKFAFIGNQHRVVVDEQEDESPSIGILLCKEANRNIVEFAVRDYTKPMGVATYRTKNEMPQEWQKALPDIAALENLLESAEEQECENE